MRRMLAVVVAFSLAFPLSAVAASGHRVSPKPACTGLGSMTQQLACLCVLHGGQPEVFYGGVTCYARVLR